MFCIYASTPDAGPLLINTGRGVAVLVFDAAACARAYAALRMPANFLVLPLAKLGTPGHAMPEYRGEIRYAVRLDIATAALFLDQGAAGFASDEHLVPFAIGNDGGYLPMAASAAQLEALQQLESAADAGAAAGLDSALAAMDRAGNHACFAAVLAVLCEAPWHTRHAQVVDALQLVGDASAVPALERAAHLSHAYLGHDQSNILARNCTWALADIGVPAARLALERLAQCANASTASGARRRLERWHEEMSRKRA